MEQLQKYVNIYTEANPNPNSLKFAVNFLLLPEGKDVDYASPEEAGHSPLAQALFQAFPAIQRVFIMSNFVTVTKPEEQDWMELSGPIKQFLKTYFEEEKPILSAEAYADDIDSNDSEVVKKIKGLLNEYVRPAVEGDGGAINFKSYDDGVVTVELRGSCSGCPSSTLTLKSGIENLLKRMMPQDVVAVVAEGV